MSESNETPNRTLLDRIEGRWTGTCRTWFEPGKLADESSVRGRFEPVLDGRFLRHRYQGSMQGKPRHGEELLAFNRVSGCFEISWIDDFHMSYGIQFSSGPAADPPSETGFSVTGSYEVGGGHPPWGWRTEYELRDDGSLRITAYNIEPDGPEAKAVETIYCRETD